MLASYVFALVRTPPKTAEDPFDFVRNPESPEKHDATCVQAKTGLGPRLGITGVKVRDGIVIHHFQKTSVGSVDVFELLIEDRVEEIIPHQRPEAVLQRNPVNSCAVESIRVFSGWR
jgi:hypothetical protein